VSGGRLGDRGLTQLRERLSERDLAVIGQVASLKLMSGRQIERIHFGVDQHATALTAARTARRVLERLVDDRLLVRLDRRVGGVRAGSASFVYGLGPVGQRVLGLGGPRRRFREPTATFVAHTLAITELVVELTLADRRRDLELLQVQTEPECWRPLGARGLATLRPDLFVITAKGDFEYRYFVEVDLGTESLPRLLSKCRIYEDYYRAGSEQHLHDVFPSVLWIMHNQDRALKLRDAIARSSSLTAEVFMVTADTQAFDVLVGEAVGGTS
jgi:hypothetical protein